MMSKGNPRNRLSVCIIERHPLAARYLRGLLSKRKFSLVIPDNVSILPIRINELKRSSIYLIDQESLPVPLVAYVRSITRAHGGVKILATGRTLPVDKLCQLLLLGIHGYVSYEEIEEKVILAIETVSRDRLWVAPDVLERFAYKVSNLALGKGRNQQAFTDRERLVLDLLQRRLSNKEISAALEITERTVRFHLGNIFNKMGVHDRHSAVDLVRSSNLLDNGAGVRPEKFER
jgi:DNA-binding NarL/FixJ family response regulator